MRPNGYFRKGTVLGIGLLSVVFLAAGCKRCVSPEKRAAWITEEIAERLELSDEQKAKLEVVKTRLVAVHQEMKKDRKANLAELESQLATKELDQKKLLEIINGKTGLVQQRAPQVVAALADFHRTLDDTQKAKVAKFLSRFKERLNDDQ